MRTDNTPHSLTTALRTAPLGIDDPHPTFAWQTGATEQAAYRLQVSNEAGEQTWDTGWVESTKPFGIRYNGNRLTSRTEYQWQVQVRTPGGAESAWSEPAPFETGLLSDDEWQADWITAPSSGDDRRTLYFRRDVELSSAVRRGRAYVSALGWYGLRINGADLTGQALVPRWTPFHDYVEYQVYDVTGAFSHGANTIGAVVADGRFRGHIGAFQKANRYGDNLALIARIELELEDGTSVVLLTDKDWTVGTGRIRTADPMHGERVDARIDDDLWCRPGGAVQDPRPAQVLEHKRHLVAEEVAPVREIHRIPATTIQRTPTGVQLIDFGQNFAGVAAVKLPSGTGTVVLKFSEIVTDGELDEKYIHLPGSPKGEWFQRDEIVLGPAPIEYTPRFTIHGFRYVAVEGLSTPLRPEDVQGVMMSSDLDQISEFDASDPRLGQLHRNVLWSLRSNFTDTPTDCPTRERSGWTGDIQVFGPTAVQMVDADAYLRRYLRNVAAEQYQDGRVPPVIPAEDSPGREKNLLRFASTSVGWGDVTVLLPWTLYQYRGDIEVLRRQYDSARSWVEGLARRARGKRGLGRRFGRRYGHHEQFILDSGFNWGEWLRPDETLTSQMAGNFLTGRPVVATAYLAHSARVLSQIAGVLENTADRARYEALADDTRKAWQAAFVRNRGARIGHDKQDDYVRALAFDLLEPGDRDRALERLVELVEEKDFHLGTGFLSTPMLLSVLTDGGRADVAMRVLTQTTSPSWLCQLERGATTIWETWEGYDKNGKAKDSHNHYAFGSVAQFLQERIGGLAPLEPGYRRILIAPIVDQQLDHASVSVDTPYGRAHTSWARSGDLVRLDATIPPGTTATVRKGGHDVEIGPGKHTLEWRVTVSTATAPELAPLRT